jgi:hypothetical protein
MRNSWRKLPYLTASASTLAVLLFCSPGISHADSPCYEWWFPAQPTQINQDNGWILNFQGSGLSANGDAFATGRTSRAQMSGKVSGGITLDMHGSGGYNVVHFVVTWRDGKQGVYDGTVDQDGFARGTTNQIGKAATYRWKSASPWQCIVTWRR